MATRSKGLAGLLTWRVGGENEGWMVEVEERSPYYTFHRGRPEIEAAGYSWEEVDTLAGRRVGGEWVRTRGIVQ